MRRRWSRLLAAAAVLAVASCGGIDKKYVSSDRATYNVIAPAYAGYVLADQSLSPAEKQRRRRLLDSWAKRISEAEK